MRSLFLTIYDINRNNKNNEYKVTVPNGFGANPVKHCINNLTPGGSVNQIPSFSKDFDTKNREEA